jgi:hypothetical protein
MFVLQCGYYPPAKLEYSYSRRAQSVVSTLVWKDTALIDVDDVDLAISEAFDAVNDWKRRGYTQPRWRLEGRGKFIRECVELFPYQDPMRAENYYS